MQANKVVNPVKGGGEWGGLTARAWPASQAERQTPWPKGRRPVKFEDVIRRD